MGPLTALVLATPIFGFALTPPQLDALPRSAMPVAQLEASANVELDGSDGAQASAEAGPQEPKGEVDQATYLKQLRRRARLAKVHRTMGIATWAAMTLAVVSGTIAYRNQYGGGNLDDTPCVRGDAWLGQDQCSGAPWLHAVPGFVTGGLYFTTMGLQIAMPDPDNAAEGDSKYAKTLRMHKTLRWVHLGGMVTQIVLGIVMANPGLGLERSSDFDTLRALSIVHLTSGYVTYGALTWAGSLMLF